MLKIIQEYINLKTGAIGAIIMGLIVLCINWSVNWQLAIVAGTKQALYTLLFGGLVIKLCERIALKLEDKWQSIILASIIASSLTICAVFFVHNLKGTPKPFESTLPVILMSPPGFFYLALRSRNNKNKKSTNKDISTFL